MENNDEKINNLVAENRRRKDIMKIKRKISKLESDINRKRDEIDSLTRQLKLLGDFEFDD